METLRTRALAQYDLALTYLKPYALRCCEVIAVQFKKRPHVASAVLVVGLGFLAILSHFPTKEGSASLAGALFGAGAVFIGAWVTENNRAAAENAEGERRKEAARLYFMTELGRIVAQQVNIMGRLVPNFSAASVGRTMPQVETWESFRPARPVLYPAAVQFRDLSESDATALINFYDSVHGIAETIDKWIETKQPQEVNAWNLLMQSVQNSLSIGAIAVTQFCPDRQQSPIAPASGTLLQNIERTASSMQRAIEAHMARHQAQAAVRKP